jgi:hypothetical protein
VTAKPGGGEDDLSLEEPKATDLWEHRGGDRPAEEVGVGVVDEDRPRR